jgi:hypothetical protein
MGTVVYRFNSNICYTIADVDKLNSWSKTLRTATEGVQA